MTGSPARRCRRARTEVAVCPPEWLAQPLGTEKKGANPGRNVGSHCQAAYAATWGIDNAAMSQNQTAGSAPVARSDVPLQGPSGRVAGIVPFD